MNWRSIWLLLLVTSSCSYIGYEEEYNVERSNFILIIADDHRFDALGSIQRKMHGTGRFPWLKTPNLDRLARNGATFQNAFVTTSLCSPSRASILTGLRTKNHRIKDNDTPLLSNNVAQKLQSRGYHTAYFGKWHMGEQGFPLPGFSHSFSFEGQGEYHGTLFNENGKPVRSSKWVDHETTDYFIDYLNKDDLTSPFFYVVGFKSMHGPWDSPPSTYEQLYANEEIQSVPSTRNSTPLSAYGSDGDEPSRRDYVYFQYLTAIDDCLGRIVKALNDRELTQNTYLIYMSDNGFLMGEHGLSDKRVAFEESIRIPLIISGPGVPQNSSFDQMVLNLDIAPSIVEWSGINDYEKSDGRSLLPLFEQTTSTWRTHFVYEYYREKYLGPETDIWSVRTDSTKYIMYENHPEWNEFFDLSKDPYEMHNLINFSARKTEIDQAKQLLSTFWKE